MSKELNKLLEHLISNNQEAASELIHSYFVTAARSVHESFIAEEDLDDELSDDEVMDDDLGDAEEEVTDDLADDGDMGDEDMGDEDMDADFDADMEGGEGEVELEDRVEDLESQLEKLQAEFDELSAVEDEEHEEMGLDGDFGDEEEAEGGEDFSGEDDGEDEGEDDGEDEGEDDELAEGYYSDRDAGNKEAAEAGRKKAAAKKAAAKKSADSDDLEESISWDDDDFLSLGESAVDDLQKVNVTMSQGEIGTGSKVAGNQASAVVSRSPGERAGGKAVEVKSTNHTGYDREKAPSSKEGTGAASPRNVRSTATAGNEKVSKGGNSTLNSTKGFGEEGKTSPIGSREMRGKGKI